MPRPKKEKGPPALEDLPKNLRMAIVKIMVKYNLDVPEALDKAAVLLDPGSRLFDEAVDKKAESKYKSRYFKQMNSARASINRSANARLDKKYMEGFDDGFEQGKNDHTIHYYCKVCERPIYIIPNSNSHQAIIRLMGQEGWGHGDCHNKK
jgi:hypothetical protein